MTEPAPGSDGLAKACLHRHGLRDVITDLHVPNMNGVTFLRALRAVLPDVPVIVSSGRLDDSNAVEFAALGVRLILDKPFTEEKLVAVLQSALHPDA